MLAHSIAEVIVQLDKIIAQTERDNNPLGYFAALYRHITLRVQTGIARQEFEDNARMERLDVIFANRYLTAWEQWHAGQPTTQAWAAVFTAGLDDNLMVMQHLAMGINAHINFDLGIAAAQTVPSEQLDKLKKDFDLINQLLAAQVDEVQRKLSQSLPLMTVLDRFAGRLDENLANFVINISRGAAWRIALGYAKQSDPKLRAAFLSRLDLFNAALSHKIQYPGWWFRRGIDVVPPTEQVSPAAVIRLLAS